MRIKLLILLLITTSLFSQSTTVYTYFEQENFEFKVYHIKGREPGATLMIIGGIHGDETSGFLAADLFADIALRQGNIILIPRSNLPSIFAGRRIINHDMNRRFAIPTPITFEDRVVAVLKKYMHQSDLMLNLHDSSGFYRHTWEGPNHNPLKYGQCLIVDTDSLFIRETGRTVHLGRVAETVINNINKQIEFEEYHYRLNNHDTLNPQSRHSEQRGSASFYGLTQAQIPSFGVEVSTSLRDASLRVMYLRLIINEFMNYLDIRPITPPLRLDRPVLNYLLVRVNDEKRFVETGDTIVMPINSAFTVTGISTNYPRGNFVDVIGHGNRNDLNKTFIIDRNTEVVVRKDHQEITTIPIRVMTDAMLAFEGFRVNLLDDNSFKSVFAGDTLRVTRGVDLEIIGALNNDSNINITIAGATNQRRQGRQIINTAQLTERYAINRDRNLYEIIVRNSNNVIANAFLQVIPLQAFGLHITHNDKRMVIAPGDTLFVEYDDTLFIHDVELNQLSSDKVRVNFAGYVLDPNREAEDRGGIIRLNSRGLIPRFAITPELDTYEIHVLYGRERYATYTVRIMKSTD